MTRKMITWAGAFVAVFSLTFVGTNVEARQCRSHHRNRCCQQTTTCASQQATSNCGYQSGCRQTARYASRTTACCTPQATCCNVQPASGTVPPAYDTPVPADSSVAPAPIVTAPAPAPGA